MDLLLGAVGGTRGVAFAPDALVIAGWTGRDAAQVELHIAELERIGVARPSTVPAFYRVGHSLLTSDARIQVVGDDSSGEVEFVLFGSSELLVGVGSDHTDRKLETVGVVQSKQLCPKPVATDVWRFADVEAHWDRLELHSFATRNGERRLYQAGSVSRMLHPRELLHRFAADGALAPGSVVFCGTLPVEGEISASDRFEIELRDPVLGRSIKHQYRIEALPVVR